ncbi:expressed unknown protein [Seminavis robusta]|uniref:BTB domain-containing protein n=1 Tax=Seminavis robusta TaxID=568900 RepID=A0A9N8HQY9_9STRA|nr:expressed unknown protein [Seminavis robusta]|eukprot:Sro1339_g264310.1 n/a (299) ;mRNA; r:20700-21596
MATERSSNGRMCKSKTEDEVMPKPRFECGAPDVTVIVGGQQFQEYSHHLRCWSGFFDAAFRSGMKEARTMLFKFPDDDPREWELVWAVLHPFSDERVNEDNVEKLFSWFQKLCISQGVDECANVLFAILEKSTLALGFFSGMVFFKSPFNSAETKIDCVLRILPMSAQCTEKKAEKCCVAYLRQVAKDMPSLFHEKQLKKMCSLFYEDSNCKAALSMVVEKFLPTDIQAPEDKNTVLNNRVLLLSFMKAKCESHRYKGALDRIPSILSSLERDTPLAASKTHSAFKNDAVLGAAVNLP